MCYWPGDRCIRNGNGEVIARAKINRVRKQFYQGCINDGMSAADVNTVIDIMSQYDSPKDVMAGLKAAKQRRRNMAGKKAAITRRKNIRKRMTV
jgi:hypothetical protein